MRTPSARLLPNTADVYPYLAAQDDDGGNDPDACYAGTPARAAVPCSAQPGETRTETDVMGRTTASNAWSVYFGPAANAYGLKARDRLVLTVSGQTHTVYVSGSNDGAGRGGYCGVPCEERL